MSHARGRLLVCAPPVYLSKGNLNPHKHRTHNSAVSSRNIGFLLRFEGERGGWWCEDSSSLCESLQMVFINILYSLKPKNMIRVHFLAFGPLIWCLRVCVYSHADSVLHIYKYWAVQLRSTFAKNNSFPAAPDAWERTKPPSVAECAVCVVFVFSRRWWRTTSLTSRLHSYRKTDFQTTKTAWTQVFFQTEDIANGLSIYVAT